MGFEGGGRWLMRCATAWMREEGKREVSRIIIIIIIIMMIMQMWW
jgi:hypothetical protein